MPEGDKHEWLKRGSVESAEVRAYYDDLAESYDRQLDDWRYRAPDEAAAMLKACVAPDASIFDAGCGTGLMGAALRAAGFTGPIDGGDLSPKSIALAKARCVYRSLSVMNFQEQPLPAAEKAYDAAVCIGVLTYIPDAGKLMRDFCRLAKPGGAVLFTHREDLFRSRDYEAMLTGLEREGLWSRLAVTEPRPYLPCNPDFAEEIGVIFGLFRVS